MKIPQAYNPFAMYNRFLSLATLLAIGLGLSACDPDVGPEAERCENGDCQYQYFDDRRLEPYYEVGDNNEEVVNGLTIRSGTLRVFEMQYMFDDEPNISDDELTEYLRFEVPMDLDSFLLSTDTELADAQAYWLRSCFCAGPLAHSVSGSIEGSRIDEDTFEVTVDLTYDDEFSGGGSVSFSRRFSKAE